jgi:branched-chain amino acid transport system substrate-binding protein
MKKKFLVSAMALTLVAGLLGGCGNKKEDDIIKIGAIGPLTGPAATYGQSVKEGASLVEKEVNDKGGINGKKIKFVFEDDQADQNASLNAFNKLVDDEKVSAIFGPVTSGATLAVAPKATQAGIPLITPTATEPSITKTGGDFVFRGCYVDSYQGVALGQYAAKDLNKKTAAVLYNVGSDYSKGIAEAFKAEYEKNGGTVVEYLTYNKDDKDFNAQLTKIKNSNPDVLLLPDYYNVVGLIAKQARDTGINATLLGGDGWESTELYKIGGEAVKGALYINHYFQGDESKVVKDFVESYKKEYNKEPDAFAALAYDSAKILVKAFEDAKSTDGAKVKEALAKTSLESVTGKISFGEDRTAIKGAVIVKVEGDHTSLVTKINP